jgi:Xaa-Pro aminopeptidase
LIGNSFLISDDEYRDRVAAVQAEMQERGLSAIMAYGAHRDYQPADLRYLARWYCIEEETACIFVPAEGSTTLITDASWDVERAEAEAYAGSVLYARDFAPVLAELVEDAGGMEAHVGISGFRIFPAPVYLSLLRELPDSTFEDATEIISDLRMIKSPAEVSIMREASRITDAAMEAGLRTIEEGRSEVEVAAVAEQVIRTAGAEPSFVTEMGAGPRTALGTFLPGQRQLERGQVAVLDCGARFHGYHGDMCRTVIVGGPGDGERAMLEAVASAVSAATETAKPSVTVGAVRNAAAAAIEEAGFGEYWWDAFMPHGNGAGQHEPPNAKEHPNLPLREGMVLCIEPGITVPGKGAFILEQMVLIGENGAETLNRLPLDMWDRL